MSLSVASIAWQLAFWATFALVVLPFPLKVYGYINGTDKSPIAVKVDETSSVLLAWIGLFAFYGFVYGNYAFSSSLWYVWLALMIVLTATGPWWSPKLAYAKEILGEGRLWVLYWVSILIYVPMCLAVFYYAQGDIT